MQFFIPSLLPLPGADRTFGATMPACEYSDPAHPKAPLVFDPHKVKPVLLAESPMHGYQLLVSAGEPADGRGSESSPVGFMVHFGSVGEISRRRIISLSCPDVPAGQLEQCAVDFAVHDTSYWFDLPGECDSLSLYVPSARTGKNSVLRMEIRRLEEYTCHYRRRCANDGMPATWSVPTVRVVAKTTAGSSV